MDGFLAIALIFAASTGILFGVSVKDKTAKREEKTESVRSMPAPIEPVVKPVAKPISAERNSEGPVEEKIEVPATEAVSESVVVSSVESVATSQAQFGAIADPWSSDSATAEPATQTSLDLGSAAESSVKPASIETVEEPTADSTVEPVGTVDGKPVEQLAIELDQPVVDLEEPRSVVAEVKLAPTIQDPKRPNSRARENLTQELLAWGQQQEPRQVSKIVQQVNHADPIVRSHVAEALGKIVQRHPNSAEVENMIPVLGKLSQDSNLQVRSLAVQALGSVRSSQVLPYLEQALRSPSTSVMKVAREALDKLKLQYSIVPEMPIALEKRTDDC